MKKDFYDTIDVLNENSSLSANISDAIKMLGSGGFSYDQIYTALHKVVDLCLYDFEINKYL